MARYWIWNVKKWPMEDPLKHISHLMCYIVILNYSTNAKLHSNKLYTQPWVSGTWKIENILPVLWVLSQEKEAICIEQRKQNRKDGSQNQWRQWLKVRSDQENYNYSPQLNPGNTDLRKRVLEFSYQPMGGWNDIQSTNIQ